MRKVDDLTTFFVSKVIKNPEVLTFRIPRGLFRVVVGKVYLYLYRHNTELKKVLETCDSFVKFSVPLLSAVYSES
jgi:ABC-type sulfate transport system permease subunit